MKDYSVLSTALPIQVSRQLNYSFFSIVEDTLYEFYPKIVRIFYLIEPYVTDLCSSAK